MVRKGVYLARVAKGNKTIHVLLTPAELERARRREVEDMKVRKKQKWQGDGKYRLL